MSGCLECAIDHHLACPLLGEEDDGFDADEDGWYSVHCCCGLAVDSRTTLDAECAEYAEELRRRSWRQPTDPSHHLGEGERLMAGGDPLGPSAACPRAGRCEACGTTRALEVATYETPVGVFCAAACDPCMAAGNPPPVRSWGQACERVGAHCQHLGIDLDQMADLLHPEAEEEEGR